jgi:cytoskeletal protein RodZ
MTEFGAGFKKARESLGVSLNQIAVETRISTRFLLAIENEEFRLLPGGIFNRGFIRTYAQRVGLDPDRAVADYERLCEKGEPDALLRTSSDSLPTANRHLYPLAIAALLLLIAIFYLVSRGSNGTFTASVLRSESPTAAEAPASTRLDSTEPDQTVLTSATEVPAVTGTAGAPAEAATEPATQPIVVDLEVHDLTWVRLETDGTEALSSNLQPGTTLRYTAQNLVDLKVGNAGGLTLKVNAHLVRLGASGEVRSLTITPENISHIIE